MCHQLRRRVFFAAKINVHENIFSQDLEKIIYEHIPRVILQSSAPIKVNTWNWSFTDVESLDFIGKNILVGNITKSKIVKQKVRIGTKTLKKSTENEIAHTAFFVYDPFTEILAHEVTGAITKNDFMKLFAQLLSSDPYVGDVRVISIPVPQKIRTELLLIENITEIKFDLIHPNPGKKEFNTYQRLIKDSSSTELSVKLSNPRGIKVKSEETNPVSTNEFVDSIEDGIYLVESGYGTVGVKGFNEVQIPGKRKKFITKKKTKRFSSSNSYQQIKTDETDHSKLVNRIIQFIKNVKDKDSGNEDD
jgi:hypothetical protein